MTSLNIDKLPITEYYSV